MNQIETFTLDDRSISLLLPSDYNQTECRYPVVYALDGTFVFETLLSEHAVSERLPFILVGLEPLDRMSEYTPWPAAALNPRFADFGGTGQEHLVWLTEAVLPHINRRLRTLPEPEHTALFGHSLGGLLAVFSLFTTPAFGTVVSVSGSFWYEHWMDYIRKTPICNSVARLYLSSGRNEGGKARDLKRDAAVATDLTCERMWEQLGARAVVMAWNDYGHQNHLPEKLRAAFDYLASSDCLQPQDEAQCAQAKFWRSSSRSSSGVNSLAK